ncbi:hypothetical protein AOL_s00140g7 [Orbilia oligospora ATCC 24927]|uniref:Uncharacterized protein n=1 Tax=Arthrobotrys oligospora (strain ATCC 24927 / CBS 115.81 / DSM 1491) TaxID=756982 RepID=G1XM38_ARTOA|nr:hypothetical protein AOL_s00140g7 [Orbilia oligospora ATCC 24927]EGX45691.1 hypothetical protein AOL_s00140g7 [Orbilia oligospora ATCC 24927]
MSAMGRSILRRREIQCGIGRLCVLNSVAAPVPHRSLGSPEAPRSRYGSTLALAESNEIQSLQDSNDVITGTIGNKTLKVAKRNHQESTTCTKKDEVEHPPDRTFEEMVVLFREIEASFPKNLGEDRWYLVLIATLTYASDPAHVADLYSYLISQPKYSTSESRKALMRRIREALVKLVCLIGVCKPITAIFRIDDVEKDEDRDYTFSRDGWQADEKNLERGKEFLGKIYRHNMPRNDEKFIAHKDFAANPLYTQSYGVKCPHNAACAYSASYVGCVGTSTSSGTTSVTPTTRPVPTTCIAFEDVAASLLTRTDISPQTLLCTGPYVLCQTFTLVQSENTFTGFTCRASTVPSATATGGSWGTYPPTSIPTPIDQLYHIAKAPYTETASSTSTGPAVTSPSSAFQVHPGMDILSIPVLLFFFLLFKAL